MNWKEAGTRSRSAVGEVSLVRLSADGVTLAWPEAVALIDQICRFLVASGTQAFDPSSIVIQPSGEVTVRSSTSSETERSVHALGELLRAHLVGTPHPVQLQMVVAQATCTPPFYRSIAELAEALSYYSSSNPQELTRCVHEHWRSSRPVPVRAFPHMVRIARSFGAACMGTAFTRCRVGWARLSRMLSPHAARPQWVTRRVLSITTGILLCIGVAGFAFAAGLGRSAAPALAATISRANGQASAALLSTMGGALELVRSRFGGTSTSADSSVASQASHPAPRPLRRRPTSRTPAAPSTLAARRGPRIEDAVVSERSVPAAVVAPLADPRPGQSAESAPATRDSHDPAGPNGSRVYSADDTDVTPPVAIDRLRPNQLTAFDREQDATAITILVGEDGRVESATLARRPTTFHDTVAMTLNLGAVKAWRFHPALQTGRPVKYRTTVWIGNQ